MEKTPSFIVESLICNGRKYELLGYESLNDAKFDRQENEIIFTQKDREFYYLMNTKQFHEVKPLLEYEIINEG